MCRKSIRTYLACALLLCATLGFAQTVSVNLDKQYQTIRGFGGMNYPAWMGSDLSDGHRATAFNNESGQLGLSILRIHVDPDKNAWGRELATAKYALSKGAIVFASPWEPPQGMWEAYTKPGTSKESKRLKTDSYAAYAQHLNDFVTYMKNNGVNLYAISVQNEPDYAHDWTWWTPTEMVNFLKQYAKNINCRIIAPESFQYTKSTSDPIINDPNAWAEVDIMGTHLYGTTVNNFAYPLFESKRGNRELWMTEVYVPNSDANSGNRWPEALTVAEHISNAMVVGGFQTYVWWFIRRSYSFIDEDGKVTKRGACMAQFSKFVRPGFVRIDATQHPGNDNNLNVSAYKKDNDVVIVAVNKNNASKTLTVSIPNCKIKTWERYVTNSYKNASKENDLTPNNTTFQITLEANSVMTLVGVGDKGTPKVEFTSPSASADFIAPATVELKVDATDQDGFISRVEFYNGDEKIGETTSAPFSFTWDNVEKGKYTLTAVAIDNEGKEARSSIAIRVRMPQGPYNGVAQQIPGTIEVEHYDEGGEGYAYHDEEEGYKSEVCTFRADEGVDLDNGEDGGYVLGWTINGEWMKYTIDVQKTDEYQWTAKVASGSKTSSFRLYIDDKDASGLVEVPQTKADSWSVYQEISGSVGTIEQGTHELKLAITGSYCNIDRIVFSSKETTSTSDITSDQETLYSIYTPSGVYVGVVKCKEAELSTAIQNLVPQLGVYVARSENNSLLVVTKE